MAGEGMVQETLGHTLRDPGPVCDRCPPFVYGGAGPVCTGARTYGGRVDVSGCVWIPATQ